ncbi:MAG: ion transporter [Arenicella sp.]
MLNAVRTLAQSRFFEHFIIALILLTAGLIGYESFPQLMTQTRQNQFETIHSIILGFFILEAAVKITAAWPAPQNYFKNRWNLFDFTLIVLSLLPFAGQFAMIGRILRLFRVLRLITALPELRLIVETLLRSIPSMLNIILLMSIIFFIYGVAGYHLFHEHDPTHWRDLSYAILTLFRIVTLEDWTDVMYTAMELSPYYGLYFVSFVVFGTFVIVNLFIAVVINNLDEAKYVHLQKLESPDLHEELMITLKSTKEHVIQLEKQLDSLKERT